MKPVILATALMSVMAFAPLAAQAETAETPDETPGLSLMERGARLFLDGLRKELDPALKELQGLAQNMEPALRSFSEEMGPALRDLFAEIEDWSQYHPPERLDNGDIILRRKTPQERDLPKPLAPGAEIDI